MHVRLYTDTFTRDERNVMFTKSERWWTSTPWSTIHGSYVNWH